MMCFLDDLSNPFVYNIYYNNRGLCISTITQRYLQPETSIEKYAESSREI